MGLMAIVLSFPPHRIKGSHMSLLPLLPLFPYSHALNASYSLFSLCFLCFPAPRPKPTT